jgi:hypothetical protein
MRFSSAALGLALVALAAAPAMSEEAIRAPADRVLPIGDYSTEKGKQLAARHDRALRDLSAEIYHCLPWIEVKKAGLGFYRPKHMSGDDVRYLSLNVLVDQEPSADFMSLSREDRAGRMFSRYVVPLLRRMTRDETVRRDEQMSGFTVIVSWASQAQSNGTRVSETIAAFVPRGVADSFSRWHMTAGELAEASHVLAWNGESAVGELKVTAWEDDFLKTFKPPAILGGGRCPPSESSPKDSAAPAEPALERRP